MGINGRKEFASSMCHQVIRLLVGLLSYIPVPEVSTSQQMMEGIWPNQSQREPT